MSDNHTEGPTPGVNSNGTAAPEEHAPPQDAASELFNRFRKAAEERGETRLRKPPKNTSLQGNPRQTAAPRSRSKAQTGDLRDPKPIGESLKTLVRTRGWSAPVAVGSVISRWEQLVGEAIAEHCKPEKFEDGVVVVICDSTAWATNLKLMKSKLMNVLEGELGKGIVTDIDIRGPQVPNWKRGRYSVRGGRGPRDTYG
ncbi:DUF721 domain-containing protein [Nesterenkonia sp. MY13]|uniref:DUF721 domain-containing protein n=1 Tax=Nesterenkonia sedimenti TaxID=1463632 RepID=A0A7X8TKU0_9MICC|nr:DciA family protein [Nesterenkonia sedimenti]NLS10429.1 DUF721 domain-containing protein [Nesterenkonia sedimenti]